MTRIRIQMKFTLSFKLGHFIDLYLENAPREMIISNDHIYTEKLSVTKSFCNTCRKYTQLMQLSRNKIVEL